MKKTFIPSMVLLSGTIDVGQSGNWNSGTESNNETIYMDQDGVIWFFDGEVWTDGEGHTYDSVQTGWEQIEP